MGTSISPQQRKSLLTKNKIYETGIQLIRTKGYANVTIDEICEKSGVTKGAFYHHFKSKDAILQSSYLDSDARILQELPTLMKKENSLEQTREIVLLYAEMVQLKGVEIIKQNIRNQLDAKHSDQEFGLFYNQFYNPNKRPMLEVQLAVLKNGQKNGEIRDDLSPEEILRHIISTFNGYVLDWSYHDGSYDFKEKIKEVWTNFMISPPLHA
jgi:TetR/AcrR family fatty acid metabolism transcriptional regulator